MTLEVPRVVMQRGYRLLPFSSIWHAQVLPCSFSKEPIDTQDFANAAFSSFLVAKQTVQ